MTPSRGAELVRLEHVDVVYGVGAAQVRAVADLSLDVRADEVLALMGPSGSGKTSLLQVIGLLIVPSRGRLFVDGAGVDVARRESASRLRRERYGFVFQSYNLFPTLTALENVMLAFDIKGQRDGTVRNRAGAMLEEVGLGGKLSSYPAQLSGGQKQRVAIARALAADPAILLADEPTGALDSETGETILALLSSLASAARAIVIVSHDSRVTQYADRVIRLRDGRLVDDDGA